MIQLTWVECLALGVDLQFLLIIPLVIIVIYTWSTLKKYCERLLGIEAASCLRAAEDRALLAETREKCANDRVVEMASELRIAKEHYDAMIATVERTAELRIASAVLSTKLVYQQRDNRRMRLASDIRFADRGHILYRFTDDKDSLLYVGITGDIRRRAREHQEDKDWWGDVAGVQLEYFQSRTDLANAERLAITTEHPRENVVIYRGSSSSCLIT